MWRKAISGLAAIVILSTPLPQDTAKPLEKTTDFQTTLCYDEENIPAALRQRYKNAFSIVNKSFAQAGIELQKVKRNEDAACTNIKFEKRSEAYAKILEEEFRGEISFNRYDSPQEKSRKINKVMKEESKRFDSILEEKEDGLLKMQLSPYAVSNLKLAVGSFNGETITIRPFAAYAEAFKRASRVNNSNQEITFQLGKTIAHEIAHRYGLPHIREWPFNNQDGKGCPRWSVYQRNFMHSGAEVFPIEMSGRKTPSRIFISPIQGKIMQNVIKKKHLQNVFFGYNSRIHREEVLRYASQYTSITPCELAGYQTNSIPNHDFKTFSTIHAQKN